MNLFKNGVGRPSNETIKKRKRFYIVGAIAITLVVSAIVLSSAYYFGSKIEGNNKNATTTCIFPYSKSKCQGKVNETVKKIQRMLISLGHYKQSYGIDGKFGPKTEAAVKAFQRSQKISADGSVGPDTLERLAKATNTNYFKIKYNKNGGSGTLNSQYNNTTVVLNGISTPTSSKKLSKTGYVHVGYIATSYLNKKNYVVGCLKSDCSTGAKGYIYTAYDTTNGVYKNQNQTIYPFVYSIGSKVSQTGWVSGQTITFNAKYCTSGYTYNRKTSKCEKSSNQSSSSGYNYSAYLTGYGPNAGGARGAVACTSDKFSSSNYKYNDKTYGSVRVVAVYNVRYNNNLPCGSIIEIQSYNDNGTKNGIKAIVLDTGVPKSDIIDLMVSSESYASSYIGKQSIKYKILRKGW